MRATHRGDSRQSTQRRVQSDSTGARRKREVMTAWGTGLEVWQVACLCTLPRCDTSGEAGFLGGRGSTQGRAMDGAVAIFSARGPRGE